MVRGKGGLSSSEVLLLRRALVAKCIFYTYTRLSDMLNEIKHLGAPDIHFIGYPGVFIILLGVFQH